MSGTRYINNGFSTKPFAVGRGVRQGDPLSAYLFIIVLEILCIRVRSSKDIRGIKVDKEEIRLSLFADDLTGFLKDNLSLVNFLKLIEYYGICSGLKINHDKSEIMILGNCSSTLQQDNAVSCNLKFQRVVKILGVHFTYDFRAKQKLNVDELISSIQQKTTNLEVEGFDDYRKNSNCPNLYYSYFPISREFDISK